MNTRLNKTQESKSSAVSNDGPKELSVGDTSVQFDDQRSETVVQRKLQTLANQYSGNNSVAQLQAMANNRTRPAGAIQQQAALSKGGESHTIQKKENDTGLPDKLKKGVESLSGHSMDDVKVHYNSAKPAQLNAHAYAQGTDIHLASGQEKHLPHEAWHVVQQKQGRVQPTLQMKDKVAINDDKGLEKEADVMGAKATQLSPEPSNQQPAIAISSAKEESSKSPVQREVKMENNLGSEAFGKAYEIFITALESQGGQIAAYLHFANSPANNHNLIFKALPPRKKVPKGGVLHGETNVTFSGSGEDILAHMFEQNLEPSERIDEIMDGIDPIRVMNGVDIEIEVFIMRDSEPAILLETLNHEFTVHAIKWHSFVDGVYNETETESRLRKRILEMRSDHDEFGTDRNEMYREVRETIRAAIAKNEVADISRFGYPPAIADKFMEISRNAIDAHKPYELVRVEIDGLMARAAQLETTPLLPKFKTRKPPKKPPQEKCCYITTACIQAQGLPDDCEELTVLRAFRDSYLKQKSNGESLIALYYEHSPKILEYIHRSEDEEEILRRLYRIIKKCVEAIKNGDNEYAYKTYCEMVIKLKDKYTPNLPVTIPAL